MDYASSLLGLLPGGRRTPGLRELLASVESYLPPEQVARMREAAEFGASAHHGQKRLSGEPYIAHPVAAAAILADLHLDADTIIAAILHDVIEDTPHAQGPAGRALRRGRGRDWSTASPSSTRSSSRAAKKPRRSRSARCCSRWCKDLRVILVKLADRTHNMRTIEAMAPARRRAIARETLEIYAPIAERLGLYNMKLELEDLGFKARCIRALPRARARAEEAPAATRRSSSRRSSSS